ncbi:hypothetical protein B0T10DRAFT_457082 [Thelonectria olida]|uniref:Uncharacterized protein n=1 Tax=Thelonectria olida TaxID=1576542 RepID=A0A9P8WB61_9HYPO|nr:hypothetical protein B0T10DRAFT_457082 [Thelonectria olida]
MGKYSTISLFPVPGPASFPPPGPVPITLEVPIIDPPPADDSTAHIVKTVIEFVLVMEWDDETEAKGRSQRALLWGGVVFSVIVGMLVASGILSAMYHVKRSRERTRYIEHELFRLDRQGRQQRLPGYEQSR